MSEYATVTYVADGATENFSVPFGYMEADDVVVTVDGVDTTDVSSDYTHTWADSVTVRIVAVSDGSEVPADYVVTIVRQTDIDDAVVTFPSGGAMRGATLNRAMEQMLYGLQEASDDASNGIRLDTDDKFDARSKVIKNVATPVDANDAVTKGYYEGTFSPQLDAKVTAATTAQTAAEAAQAAAEVAQTAAEAAQAAAEAAETGADASETASVAAQGAAEAAQAAAEAAQAASEAALDELTDLYLGAKAADPAVDNDGNALQDGALYFNTTSKVFRGYNLGDTTWYDADDASSSAASAASSQAAAETAQAAAEAAQTASEAAQASAEAAQTGAETAQTGSESAETGAVAAQTASETAQAAAVAAQTAAEAAQTASETAKDASVAAKNTAVTKAAEAALSASSAETFKNNAAVAAIRAAAQAAVRSDFGYFPSVFCDPQMGDTSLFSHSRASTAYQVNADGSVSSAGTDLRDAFHPTTGSRLGVLLESPRTYQWKDNQVGTSTGTQWHFVNTNLNRTADVGTAPDGTTTADRLIPTTTNALHRYQAWDSPEYNCASGAEPVVGKWVKGAGYSRCRWTMTGAGTDVSVDFDLRFGGSATLVAGSGDYGITGFVDGWYFIWISDTTTSSGVISPIWNILDDSGNTTFAGDGTSGIDVSTGIMFQDGGVPASFMVVGSSTVTRAADLATVDLSAEAAWRPDAYTFVLQVILQDASDGTIAHIYEGAGSDDVEIVLISGDIHLVNSAGLSVALTSAAGFGYGDRVCVAVRVQDGAISGSVNGLTAVDDAVGTFGPGGAADTLSIGSDSSGAENFSVIVRRLFTLGPVTNTELENISYVD